MKNDILWIKCKCGENLLPKIIVRFGLDLLKNKSFNTYFVDEIVLHSPYNLKINIKNAVMKRYGTNLDILNFKSLFKALFWDFIWYCNIHNLDYSIILPYLKDLENAKQISYFEPNREIFEITFNQDLYQQNLKKIEKIAHSFVNKKQIPFKKLEIKKEISFDILKPIKTVKKEEEEDDDDEEEYEEEEEEEEDDLDDVNTDLNIPINKNISNSKNPVNIFQKTNTSNNNGLLDKLKLKKDEDKKK